MAITRLKKIRRVYGRERFHSEAGRREKSSAAAEAVERAHFFAKPVFVPIITGHKVPGLAEQASQKISERFFGGLPPQSAENKEAAGHGKNLIGLKD